MSAKTTTKALVLTLGNAPNTWHTVEGLPGYFHPQFPVPVGAPGFPSEKAADKAHRDPGCPVEVRQVNQRQVDRALNELAELRVKVVDAIRAQRDVAPVEQVEQAVEAENDKE